MHEKLTKYGKLTAHNERKIPIHMQMLFHETYIRFLRTYIVTLIQYQKNFA